MNPGKHHFIYRWLDGVAKEADSAQNISSPTKSQPLKTQPSRDHYHLRIYKCKLLTGETIRRSKRRQKEGCEDGAESLSKKARIQGGDLDTMGTSITAYDQAHTHGPTFSDRSNALATYTQRRRLAHATPKLLFVPFGRQNQPESVRKLFRHLMQGSLADLPDSLKILVEQKYPGEIIPPPWENEIPHVTPTSEQLRLWESVTAAYGNAIVAQSKFYTEDIFQEPLLKLLRSPTASKNDNAFRIYPIGTARIVDPSPVPHLDGHPVYKKVDVAVSFSGEDETTSQTDHSQIGHLPQLLAVELKPRTALTMDPLFNWGYGWLQASQGSRSFRSSPPKLLEGNTQTQLPP
ncbi:hypothetical protein AJ79_01191 [Helicocarpus griseus UAMH5409]|uniref:Uncharacterized protein n=1 Tax=Helicocarpus griseus UAMH5409 TaxID=1447875 RepID=A0A2B7Y9M5_9EURO|nr:hypothetical protein AJ79_01191 [Helicocarpus griseus UAMH5409]